MTMTLKGNEVFVAPVEGGAWVHAGSSEVAMFAYDIDAELEPAVVALFGPSRTLTFTVPLTRRFAKDWARLFRVPLAAIYRPRPWPLPAAALPLSKRRSRRRWR